MAISYFELVQQFLGGLTFILVLFFTASIIQTKQSLTNKQSWDSELYVKQALLLVLFVSVFSILKTKFNTINIGLLGVFVFEFFRRKVYSTYALSLEGLLRYKKPLLYAICIYCFWFLFIASSLYYDNVPNVVRSPQRDLIYYSNLSQQLVNFGKEDVNLYLHDSIRTGRSAYHYFELWLNGLLGDVLNIVYFKTFVLSLKVILLSLCSLLFYSIVSFWFDSEKKWIVLLSPLLLLLKPLLILTMPNLKGFVDYYFFDPREEVYFLCFLLEIYFFIKRGQLSLIGLSILILASVTTLPALVPFVFLLFLCKIIWKWKSLPYSSFLLFFGALSFLVLFYTLNKSSMPGSTSFSLSGYFASLHLKTSVNIFLGNIIYLFVVSIPFLIAFTIVILLNKIQPAVFFKQVSTTSHSLFPFLFLLILVSNAAYALLYPLSDSSQIFNNVSMTTIVLIYALLLIFIFKHFEIKYNAVSYLCIGLLILICGYRSFFGSIDFSNEEKVSKPYFDTITEYSKEGKVNKGVSFPSTGFYGMIQNWNDKLTWLGQYLYYLNPKILAVNIDIDSSRLSAENSFQKNWQRNLLESSHIQKFIKEQSNKKDSLLSMADYQLRYVKQNNIDFIIVDVNNNLPNTIRPMVKDSIVDSYSKQRFYLLEK